MRVGMTLNASMHSDVWKAWKGLCNLTLCRFPDGNNHRLSLEMHQPATLFLIFKFSLDFSLDMLVPPTSNKTWWTLLFKQRFKSVIPLRNLGVCWGLFNAALFFLILALDVFSFPLFETSSSHTPPQHTELIPCSAGSDLCSAIRGMSGREHHRLTFHSPGVRENSFTLNHWQPFSLPLALLFVPCRHWVCQHFLLCFPSFPF